jgi:hypothetical protein
MLPLLLREGYYMRDEHLQDSSQLAGQDYFRLVAYCVVVDPTQIESAC